MIASLNDFIRGENVHTAQLTAIGALSDLVLNVFRLGAEGIPEISGQGAGRLAPRRWAHARGGGRVFFSARDAELGRACVRACISLFRIDDHH